MHSIKALNFFSRWVNIICIAQSLCYITGLVYYLYIFHILHFERRGSKDKLTSFSIMTVLDVMLCFQPRTSLHQTTKSRIFDHNDDHWCDNKGGDDTPSGFEHEPCHVFGDRWTHLGGLCSLASTTNDLNAKQSWKYWHFQPSRFCYASFVLCTVTYCIVSLKVSLLYQLLMYISDAIERLKNIEEHVMIYRLRFTFQRY
jgi:hypothetical protein